MKRFIKKSSAVFLAIIMLLTQLSFAVPLAAAGTEVYINGNLIPNSTSLTDALSKVSGDVTSIEFVSGAISQTDINAIANNDNYAAKLEKLIINGDKEKVTGSFTIPYGAFDYYTALKVAELPQATEVMDNAFMGCENLISVKIAGTSPNVALNSNSFKDCGKLVFADIGNCKTISSSCFENCKALKTVYALGCSEIKDKAFYNCENINELHLPYNTLLDQSNNGVPKSRNTSNAYFGCPSDRKIIIHDINGVGFETAVNKYVENQSQFGGSGDDDDGPNGTNDKLLWFGWGIGGTKIDDNQTPGNPDDDKVVPDTDQVQITISGTVYVQEGTNPKETISASVSSGFMETEAQSDGKYTLTGFVDKTATSIYVTAVTAKGNGSITFDLIDGTTSYIDKNIVINLGSTGTEETVDVTIPVAGGQSGGKIPVVKDGTQIGEIEIGTDGTGSITIEDTLKPGDKVTVGGIEIIIPDDNSADDNDDVVGKIETDSVDLSSLELVDFEPITVKLYDGKVEEPLAVAYPHEEYDIPSKLTVTITQGDKVFYNKVFNSAEVPTVRSTFTYLPVGNYHLNIVLQDDNSGVTEFVAPFEVKDGGAIVRNINLSWQDSLGICVKVTTDDGQTPDNLEFKDKNGTANWIFNDWKNHVIANAEANAALAEYKIHHITNVYRQGDKHVFTVSADGYESQDVEVSEEQLKTYVANGVGEDNLPDFFYVAEVELKKDTTGGNEIVDVTIPVINGVKDDTYKVVIKKSDGTEATGKITVGADGNGEVTIDGVNPGDEITVTGPGVSPNTVYTGTVPVEGEAGDKDTISNDNVVRIPDIDLSEIARKVKAVVNIINGTEGEIVTFTYTYDSRPYNMTLGGGDNQRIYDSVPNGTEIVATYKGKTFNIIVDDQGATDLDTNTLGRFEYTIDLGDGMPLYITPLLLDAKNIANTLHPWKTFYDYLNTGDNIYGVVDQLKVTVKNKTTGAEKVVNVVPSGAFGTEGNDIFSVGNFPYGVYELTFEYNGETKTIEFGHNMGTGDGNRWAETPHFDVVVPVDINVRLLDPDGKPLSTFTGNATANGQTMTKKADMDDSYFEDYPPIGHFDTVSFIYDNTDAYNPEEIYTINVDIDGYKAVTCTVDSSALKPLGKLSFVYDVTITLEENTDDGKVDVEIPITGDDGDGKVTVIVPDPTDPSGKEEITVDIDENGNITIPDMNPGDEIIVKDNQGNELPPITVPEEGKTGDNDTANTNDGKVIVDEIDLGGNGDAVVEIPIEGGKPGDKVDIDTDDDGKPDISGEIDDDGHVKVPDVEDGDTITVIKPDGTPENIVVDTDGPDTDKDDIPETDKVTLTYKVSGTVTNSSGSPIANATIKFGGTTVKTDADGNYTIKGLTNGTNGTVRASKSGYLSKSGSFKIESNNAVVDFVLSRSTSTGGGGGYVDNGDDGYVDVEIPTDGGKPGDIIIVDKDGGNKYPDIDVDGDGTITIPDLNPGDKVIIEDEDGNDHIVIVPEDNSDDDNNRNKGDVEVDPIYLPGGKRPPEFVINPPTNDSTSDFVLYGTMVMALAASLYLAITLKKRMTSK